MKPCIGLHGRGLQPTKTSSDRATGSLYLELRPLPAARTIEVEEDVKLDLGDDGTPVGYDIQHASNKRELIARLVLPRLAAGGSTARFKARTGGSPPTGDGPPVRSRVQLVQAPDRTI